jgi:hypothetical protein
MIFFAHFTEIEMSLPLPGRGAGRPEQIDSLN